MKTLMKEKIKQKKIFVNATIRFYEESIKTKREKIAAFNDSSIRFLASGFVNL